jgi:hypothetical protein
MKSSISQIKNSDEGCVSRLDQETDRKSGLEDEEAELEWQDKNKQKHARCNGSHQ